MLLFGVSCSASSQREMASQYLQANKIFSFDADGWLVHIFSTKGNALSQLFCSHLSCSANALPSLRSLSLFDAQSSKKTARFRLVAVSQSTSSSEPIPSSTQSTSSPKTPLVAADRGRFACFHLKPSAISLDGINEGLGTRVVVCVQKKWRSRWRSFCESAELARSLGTMESILPFLGGSYREEKPLLLSRRLGMEFGLRNWWPVSRSRRLGPTSGNGMDSTITSLILETTRDSQQSLIKSFQRMDGGITTNCETKTPSCTRIMMPSACSSSTFFQTGATRTTDRGCASPKRFSWSPSSVCCTWFPIFISSLMMRLTNLRNISRLVTCIWSKVETLLSKVVISLPDQPWVPHWIAWCELWKIESVHSATCFHHWVAGTDHQDIQNVRSIQVLFFVII